MVTAVALLASSITAAHPAIEVPAGSQRQPPSRAIYVPMADGTRLAVDVVLPTGYRSPERVPALVVVTRYGRSRESLQNGAPVLPLAELDRLLLDEGYALVNVDARGSGASFGTRPTEYGDQEVLDGYDIVDWVVQQPWSSGAVGSYGTSYTGTTAELLAATGHPAVKAVIPGWSDFDIYVSPVRPYGLVASGFIRTWSTFVGWLDDNDVGQFGSSIRRVDADADGAQRDAAVAQHRDNPDVYEVVSFSEYRDDEYEGLRPWHVGPIRWKDAIESSAVPMLVLVSWLDAGTIDGALARFRHFSNPQKLVILASDHGGGLLASPFRVGSEAVAPEPSLEEQRRLRLEFFDHYLKGVDNDVEEWPAIRYYNLGEERFRETGTWPPPGVRAQRRWLGPERSLREAPPDDQDAADAYVVDFDVSTGTNNRWMTQMGEPVLNLDDRSAMDARMLTYTSSPLAADLQVTGTPIVSLQVSSDADDGAFLVYLEDVDPSGRSRYVTEGGLRAIHRKLSTNPWFPQEAPYHSFERADAMPLAPGEVAELRFQMWPTSVLFERGHRIRIAIAGADAGMFDRLPAEGSPTIRVWRSAARSSWIELPVVEPDRP